MRKIAAVSLFSAVALFSQAQNWVTTLNSGSGLKLGLSSSHPLSFYTNNTLRLTLDASGHLTMADMAGTGSRLIKTDASGLLSSFAAGTSSQVLYGDGNWGSLPAVLSSLGTSGAGSTVKVYSTAPYFGVNTSNPVEVLDVAGNAAVSGNVKAQGAMILSNKFELKYIPANGSDPNTLSFRPGLPNNPINPTDPPMKYKPLCNVFFTPPPNIGGSAASYAFSCQAANLFQDLVQISDQMSNNTTAISLGIMNGSGILAVENLSGYTPIGNEALKLNPGCAMNVNICEGGGYTKMFNGAGVLGDLDVSTRVKIGSGTFPLQSQLEMNLISAVPKAISIQNLSSAATDKRIFEVSQTGKTSIGVNMQTNTSMLTVGQANKADLALSLTDNTSTTNKDFFNVYGNGYTEIKVYSPAGMPVPTYSGVTGPRVLTIRDFSANKDLFVVRANGKVYAREVEINLATNFPDYVFAKEYKLKPIGEVARYIDANQHLPGFEKGEYYEKNGINVNEMMIKQQEKIEEQMLYIIQLEKRLKALENRK